VQELERREVHEPDKICKHSAPLLSNSVPPQMNPAALFRYLVFFAKLQFSLGMMDPDRKGTAERAISKTQFTRCNHHLQLNILAHSNKGNHDHQITAIMLDTIWIQKTKQQSL